MLHQLGVFLNAKGPRSHVTGSKIEKYPPAHATLVQCVPRTTWCKSRRSAMGEFLIQKSVSSTSSASIAASGVIQVPAPPRINHYLHVNNTIYIVQRMYAMAVRLSSLVTNYSY